MERLSCIKGADGNLVSISGGIAELFYEQLYRHEGRSPAPTRGPSERYIVTASEINRALSRLKANKCGAGDGLVPETLETGHQGLAAALAALFADILSGSMILPTTGGEHC